MKKRAILSNDKKYRYTLEREWEEGLPEVLFIMLNPSTADAEKDDPTIRRCIGLAQNAGYGKLVVVNLYAFRATDPRDLPADARTCEADGPGNDAVIQQAARHRNIVAAWGADERAPWRARQVLQLIPQTVFCYGLTKGGAPRHPLYLPKNAEMLVFRHSLKESEVSK